MDIQHLDGIPWTHRAELYLYNIKIYFLFYNFETLIKDHVTALIYMFNNMTADVLAT